MKYDKRHKVVVVGNSPNLLNHSMGNIIDGHSIVIRCNYCHTRGFENSTGTKTDIWCTTMTHNKCKFRDKDFLNKNKKMSKRSSLLFSPDELRQKMVWLRHDTNKGYVEQVVRDHHGKDVKWENMGRGKINKGKWGHPAGPYHFCDNIRKNVIPYLDKHFKSSDHWVVTTGVAAMLYALTKYKKINIIGFSFYTENAHRINKTYNGLTLSENLRKEARNHTLLLEPLVSEGRINFILPAEKELFYQIFNKQKE